MISAVPRMANVQPLRRAGLEHAQPDQDRHHEGGEPEEDGEEAPGGQDLEHEKSETEDHPETTRTFQITAGIVIEKIRGSDQLEGRGQAHARR